MFTKTAQTKKKWWRMAPRSEEGGAWQD